RFIWVIVGANNSIEETEDIKPIILRTKISTDGEYRQGDLLYGDSKERHPFLCSRRSSYHATGLKILVSNAQQLGFSLTTAKDRNGDDRPFIVFHNVFTVDASKFEAYYKSFDHVCDVFPNGYVASRFDFQNYNEYKKVITS
ncbi:hypothetical protein GCK32_020603, partial [Trichostrongylus colubriformis]